MNYLEEFKNRIQYRTAAIIIVFMSIAFFIGLIILGFGFEVSLLVGGIFLLIAFIVAGRYSCPKCEKRFNIFANIECYEYCEFCGEHIYIVEDKEEEI